MKTQTDAAWVDAAIAQMQALAANQNDDTTDLDMEAAFDRACREPDGDRNWWASQPIFGDGSEADAEAHLEYLDWYENYGH